jgi:hypothetical protein
VGHELIEFWREHDSTGLRAAPKLNTPLLRCAVVPETHVTFSVASVATQQIGKTGSRQVPRFVFSLKRIFGSGAVMMPTPAGAVLAQVSIMRSRAIWRLRRTSGFAAARRSRRFRACRCLRRCADER